ncbi:MAG TPA: hypothetical protein VHN98_11235, partial [Acidimicrobiales bacterium]|nr:hypothetical protein [Acidimicrobiales bacterium]
MNIRGAATTGRGMIVLGVIAQIAVVLAPAGGSGQSSSGDLRSLVLVAGLALIASGAALAWGGAAPRRAATAAVSVALVAAVLAGVWVRRSGALDGGG